MAFRTKQSVRIIVSVCKAGFLCIVYLVEQILSRTLSTNTLVCGSCGKWFAILCGQQLQPLLSYYVVIAMLSTFISWHLSSPNFTLWNNNIIMCNIVIIHVPVQFNDCNIIVGRRYKQGWPGYAICNTLQIPKYNTRNLKIGNFLKFLGVKIRISSKLSNKTKIIHQINCTCQNQMLKKNGYLSIFLSFQFPGLAQDCLDLSSQFKYKSIQCSGTLFLRYLDSYVIAGVYGALTILGVSDTPFCDIPQVGF